MAASALRVVESCPETGQALAVLAAIAAGFAIYAAAVWALRVPEARQVRQLLVSRGHSEG